MSNRFLLLLLLTAEFSFAQSQPAELPSNTPGIPEQLSTIREELSTLNTLVEDIAAQSVPNPALQLEEVGRQYRTLSLMDQDLDQQRVMAAGTETSAGVGIVQLFISAVGALLLFLTLVYTRKALAVSESNLEEIRQSTKTELRAYLTLESTTFSLLEEERMPHDIHVIEIISTWVNSGMTPAFEIKGGFRYQLRDVSVEGLPTFLAPRWRDCGIRGKDQNLVLQSVVEFDDEVRNDLIEVNKRFFIQQRLVYRDAFNRKIEQWNEGEVYLMPVLENRYGAEKKLRLEVHSDGVGFRETIDETASLK